MFNKNCEVIYAEKGDTILAAAVLFPRKKLGLCYSATAFYIPYDGILLNPLSERKRDCHKIALQEQLVADILQEIGNKFQYVTLKLSPDLFDLRPFVWQNWQVEPEYSVVFNFAELSPDYDSIENSQKRKLKQIEKLNMEIVESDDSQILFDFWSQSYAGHRRKTPLPEIQFKQFVDNLIAAKIGKLYFLQQNAIYLAGLFVLQDKESTYFMFSGRNFENESSGTELYLIYQTLLKYQSAGFKKADLLGAMVPSIAKVKLELGGKLKRSDNVTFYRNSRIKFLIHKLIKQNERSRNS